MPIPDSLLLLYHLAHSAHIAYDDDMLSRSRGFTLVEVLVILVVIGLIAVIGMVTWNGTQTWSQNKARENEINQWASTFELFKSKYSYYPGTPTLPTSVPASSITYGPYCLGTFPTTTNKCADYTATGIAATGASSQAVATAAILADVAKVGNVPTNQAKPVKNKYIGPLVAYTVAPAGTQVTVTITINGIFEGSPSATNCPKDTTYRASSPYGDATMTTCYIAKTFSYTP